MGVEVGHRLSSLVSSLAESSSLEQLEERYVAQVRQLMPARTLGFYILDPDTHRVEYVGAYGVSEYFLARYEQHGRGVDPLLARTFEFRRAVSVEDLMGASEWLRHPMYTEACHLHDMTRLVEAPVICGGGVVGTLCFAGRDGSPPFSVAERAMAGSLGHLVGIGLATMRDRSRLEHERYALEAALDLCEEAVVITDLHRGQRTFNSAAAELLARVRDVSIDELMAESLKREQCDYAQARVELADGGHALLGLRTLAAGGDRSVSVGFLFLDSEAGGLPRDMEARLTAREREVAGLVVHGLRNAEIARRLIISPHTVNQHLKSIYRKLGVDSRLELTRQALAAHPSN